MALVLSSLIGLERACGSGLPLLALFVTATHFLVIYGYVPLARRALSERSDIHVQYIPGRGAVEKIMKLCAGRGYSIQEVAVEGGSGLTDSETRRIHLQLSGRRGIGALLIALGDIKGVVRATLHSMEASTDH